MRAVRDFLSGRARQSLFEARRLSGTARAMPHFIVIGAQKSGTSSIFSYLRQHPQILRPIFKEPYFFDRHYHRGLRWYGCNFPSRRTIERLNDQIGRPHVTFEATATYVFDAEVPARIASDLGSRKFILLLRNPVERAVSAYWHARRMGKETRSLADAVEADMRRCEQDMLWESGRGSRPEGEPPRPAYVRRGIYHEAVSRWQSTFSPEHLLVLQSETMFANPGKVMADVFQFLDLPVPANMDYAPQNVGGYNEKDAGVRRMLDDFYRPHNAHLNVICKTSFSW